MFGRRRPCTSRSKSQKGPGPAQKPQECAGSVVSENSAKAKAGFALADAALMSGDFAQLAELADAIFHGPDKAISLDDPPACGGSSSSGCASPGAKHDKEAVLFEVECDTKPGDIVFVVGGGHPA